MSQFQDWANLPPDLVRCIGHGLDDLKCYASARGACTAWRRALAPPSPSLLLVLEDGGRSRFNPAAVSLPTRCCFELQPVPWDESRAFCSLFVRPGHVDHRAHSGKRFVGSGNGWLALDFCSIYDLEFIYILFNPATAAEIFLPPLVYGKGTSLFSKLVFAPNPAQDDFAAAAICDRNRLAYVTAGARRWAVLQPIHLLSGTDRLADIVYHGEGTVYCLTQQGNVHVLHLPARRRRKPIILVYPDARAHHDYDKLLEVLPGSVGSDLNARAMVEPLVAREGGSLPFDPSTSFSPAYNAMLDFTSVQNLVFCGDNLYQIWRNSSCTVNLRLPEGEGRRRVQENEVFVLRYYPDRQPCWDAVTDLGGYAVFVGRNNAVSMYAEDVPGLKGNCVYWIGGSGRDRCMVFDMETRMSTPYLPLPAMPPQSKICCWYFLSDLVKRRNTNAVTPSL